MITNIKYTLRNSVRAKRMRLAVYCDGSVVVTAPMGAEQSRIEKFISDKKRWVLNKIGFFKSVDKKDIRTFSNEDYQKYKEDAMRLVQDKVAYYNKLYGFKINRIYIKNQKTRWGSCSGKQNLNINYRILFLPEKLQNYLVVHEICHLEELNHSNKFWCLVQKTLPDYMEIKKTLKSHV